MTPKIKIIINPRLSLFALLLFATGCLVFMSNDTASAAQCLDRGVNDCSAYPDSVFPNGQRDPNGCYSVVRFSDIGGGNERIELSQTSCSNPPFENTVSDNGGTGNGGGSGATDDASRFEESCEDRGNCCEEANLSSDNCVIVDYLVTFTRVLSGIVGIVIVIMIAVGGIQYSAARDNPQAVVAARGRIINALVALVLYLFSFAILQWLIPGGIL